MERGEGIVLWQEWLGEWGGGGGDEEFGVGGGEGGDDAVGWGGWTGAWVGWAHGDGARSRERGARDNPFSGRKGVIPGEQWYERGVYAADYEQRRAVAWVVGLGDGVQKR